jgi:RNA-directed DNA polymerase
MPRRHDDLFGRIASFQALHAAARRAIKGKRKKLGTASFFANLERELLALERQLRDGSYRPGRYVAFEVSEPKKRIVSAAPFRDRVVHHALCAVVEPIFEKGFVGQTFANRAGKGTHRAIATYERYRDWHAHVLRCDIYRYFPAIEAANTALSRSVRNLSQIRWLIEIPPQFAIACIPAPSASLRQA